MLGPSKRSLPWIVSTLLALSHAAILASSKLLVPRTAASRICHAVHDAAAARSVTVSVTGQPAVLPGVRRLIYEIVYNLCDNAIKYNRDGGRVDVTVAADAGGSSITVADTGIGIAPEHQARVFERFYRVDKSHSKASGGTGLGLSIVKHIVERHRGRLEIDSEVQKGTTITITLPADPRGAQGDASAPADEPALPA